jgi:hypothetical protein
VPSASEEEIMRCYNSFRVYKKFLRKRQLCISGFKQIVKGIKLKHFLRKPFLIVESHRISVPKIKPVNNFFSSFEPSFKKNNYHSQTFSLSLQIDDIRLQTLHGKSKSRLLQGLSVDVKKKKKLPITNTSMGFTHVIGKEDVKKNIL